MKLKKNVPKDRSKVTFPQKWKGNHRENRINTRKKVCRFTADPELAKQINYKNIELLERFITNRGKIIPKNYRNQRSLSKGSCTRNSQGEKYRSSTLQGKLRYEHESDLTKRRY